MEKVVAGYKGNDKLIREGIHLVESEKDEVLKSVLDAAEIDEEALDALLHPEKFEGKKKK